MAAARTERLMKLLIMLLVQRRHIGKERIRELLYPGQTDEAFNRMFERDKDDLRALGVPVDVSSTDAFFEDEIGYRIKPDDLQLPDIDLSPDDSYAYKLSCTQCEVPRPGTGTRAWSTRRQGEDNGYMAAMDRWILHLAARHPDAEAPCLNYLSQARARLLERRDART